MLKEGSTGSSFCSGMNILEWFTYISFPHLFHLLQVGLEAFFFAFIYMSSKALKFELPKRGEKREEREKCVIFEGLRLLTVMTSVIKNIWSIFDHFDNIVHSCRQIIGGPQYFNINSNFHFIHGLFLENHICLIFD